MLVFLLIQGFHQGNLQPVMHTHEPAPPQGDKQPGDYQYQQQYIGRGQDAGAQGRKQQYDTHQGSSGNGLGNNVAGFLRTRSATGVLLCEQQTEGLDFAVNRNQEGRGKYQRRAPNQ